MFALILFESCRPTPRNLARRLTRGFAFLAVLVAAGALQASVYVQQMKLETLVEKASRIVRGTVVKISEGQVSAGGGSLLTVTYQIKVKETMAGTPADVVNLTMIAEPKSQAKQGNATRLPLVELPQLKEGEEYLLFTTKPSKAGLTSTVGLVQGCFSITKKGDTEFAVNGANNGGLGLGTQGPVQYEELAKRIRALRPN